MEAEPSGRQASTDLLVGKPRMGQHHLLRPREQPYVLGMTGPTGVPSASGQEDATGFVVGATQPAGLPPPNHRAAPERPQASGGGAASHFKPTLIIPDRRRQRLAHPRQLRLLCSYKVRKFTPSPTPLDTERTSRQLVQKRPKTHDL